MSSKAFKQSASSKGLVPTVKDNHPLPATEKTAPKYTEVKLYKYQ